MDSYSELRIRAKRGEPLRIDATRFSVVRLSWLARDIQDGGGKLTLFNADALERHERGSIERNAPGRVVFEPK
jgi:hypothetical protein